MEPVRPGSKREGETRDERREKRKRWRSLWSPLDQGRRERERKRERDGEVSGPQLISKPGGERQERRNSIKIQKESAKGR